MKAAAAAAKEPPTGVCTVCGKPIRRGLLMCAVHWRQVPTPMQVHVWRTWSQFNNRKNPAHALQALAEYRRAADAATNYVTALESAATPTPNPNQETAT